MRRLLLATAAMLAFSCAHGGPSTPSPQYSALLRDRRAVSTPLPDRPSLPDGQRVEQDDADRALAAYFAAHCTPQREDAAVYLPAKGTVIPMSLYSNGTMVVMDADRMQSVLRTEDEVIEAHCHAVDTSAILLRVQERRGRRLLRLDPEVLRNRLLLERPSPVSAGGDIGTTLETELLMRSRQARVEHRLYVVERGLPPRGISYGISADMLPLLKSPMGSLHLWAVYERLWAEYNKGHCMFDELLPCVEPSFAGFADAVNSEGSFFIKDRGYIRSDEAQGTR